MITPATHEYTAAEANAKALDPLTTPSQPLNNPEEEQHQVALLSAQVAALTQALAVAKATAHASTNGHVQEHPEPRYKGTKVGVRFVWRPRWLDESGLPEELGGLYPVLTALLEREDRPGKPVDVTYGQLARVVGVHPETAKKRLSELKARGYVKVSPGSGKRPTMVKIEHPIRTPLAYDEVSWVAGGMGPGTPEGVLESLTGADKHYAELYGVEIPEPTPIPDQDATSPETEGPPVVGLPMADEAGGGEEDPPWRGGNTPPSETRDKAVLSESVGPDTRAQEETRRRKGSTDRETPARKMESKATTIPVQEVSEGAVGDARLVCEALQRRDEPTAVRTAQIAEFTRRRSRAYLWPEIVSRIRKTVEGGVAIHRPGPYLCRVILDVESSVGRAGEGGRELAGRVLAVPQQDAGDDPAQRRREGYEWLFGD